MPITRVAPVRQAERPVEKVVRITKLVATKALTYVREATFEDSFRITELVVLTFFLSATLVVEMVRGDISFGWSFVCLALVIGYFRGAKRAAVKRKKYVRGEGARKTQ